MTLTVVVMVHVTYGDINVNAPAATQARNVKYGRVSVVVLT